MAKLIHAMIRVRDEQRSLEFYRQAFEFETSHRLDFETFTLTYIRNAESDFEIELTINKDQTEPYAMGDGYGHLALVVDDLNAQRDLLLRMQASPTEIKEFSRDGDLLARFFFVQDPDGYKIEVLERHGHYR